MVWVHIILPPDVAQPHAPLVLPAGLLDLLQVPVLGHVVLLLHMAQPDTGWGCCRYICSLFVYKTHQAAIGKNERWLESTTDLPLLFYCSRVCCRVWGVICVKNNSVGQIWTNTIFIVHLRTILKSVSRSIGLNTNFKTGNLFLNDQANNFLIHFS